MKTEARDTVSKVGEKHQMLLMVQSTGNKSRELYDIRQESEFRQNKGKKIYGKMLVSMQTFRALQTWMVSLKGRQRAKEKNP